MLFTGSEEHCGQSLQQSRELAKGECHQTKQGIIYVYTQRARINFNEIRTTIPHKMKYNYACTSRD